MDGLYDAQGRHIHYLRVSVTDRCNFRCRYCMPGRDIEWLAPDQILRYEELLRIIRVFVRLGVDKVRITGGEPLMRKNILSFLGHVAEIPGINELVLTTNGSLLEQYACGLKQAGVRRINVSLDTLNPSRFTDLAGQDQLDQVLVGLDKAQAVGLSVKINMVVMKAVNSDELADFAALTLQHPYQVRFIEYMPFGSESNRLLTANEMKEQLSTAGYTRLVPETSDESVAQIYRLPGALGTIGFITPISRHFCHTCNRIRLTADGCLKPCLLSNQEYSLRELLRSGISDSELMIRMKDIVFHKPAQHQLDANHKSHRTMSRIGG